MGVDKETMNIKSIICKIRGYHKIIAEEVEINRYDISGGCITCGKKIFNSIENIQITWSN